MDSKKIETLIVCTAALFILTAIIWIFLKTGVVETSKQQKKRLQQEADALAEMPPDVRQLHIDAERKMAEAKYSIVIFIMTCIFSGTLIYYVTRSL